jgi:hypothetical protein
MTEVLGNSFKAAVRDYYLLRNRDYPGKPSVKLVGDRYRLTGTQRTILFRGITPGEKAIRRKSKMILNPGDLKGRNLYIDGCNVLLTIVNYMMGKPVFIGNDGILRDAGDDPGTKGKEDIEALVYRAVETLLDFLCSIEVHSITLYLDTKAENSRVYKDALKKAMQSLSIEGEVRMVQSADNELKKIRDEVIVTSDSEIIDAVQSSVLDAARHSLEKRFEMKALNLEDLL